MQKKTFLPGLLTTLIPTLVPLSSSLATAQEDPAAPTEIHSPKSH